MPPQAVAPAMNPARPNWGTWPAPSAQISDPGVVQANHATPSDCPACGDTCGPTCAVDCCPPALPPECPETYCIHSWFSIEHLRWAIKDGPLPAPLVTSTTTLGSVAPAVLGDAGTIVLYGSKDIDYDTAHGMKLACGVYDPSLNLGLEGAVFVLEDVPARFEDRVQANENRFLARPFYNLQDNIQDVFYLAFPGAFYGGINVTSTSRFWGAEGNITGCVYADDGCSIDLIGGFRYMYLKEGLTITDNTVIVPGGAQGFFLGDPVNDGQIVRQDNFDTQNKFYGGQFGFRTELYLGKLFANFKGLVAVGTNHTSSTIRGQSQLFSTSGQSLNYTTAGGMLAVRENSNRISQDSATVIPIFEVNVGCDITTWLRAYAGYTFIYWGSVTRPGDQIDVRIDPRSIPTSATYDPAFRGAGPRNPFDRSDFWAQGLSLGLAVRF